MKKYKNILIIVGVMFSIFLFVNVILMMIHVKRTDAISLTDDLTCHYREKVYVDQFIKDLDGVLLDKYLVDTSVVGKRKIEVQYKNHYGFVERKVFDIEVKDIVAPMIVVSNPYTVVVGQISNLLDVIFCADDYDDGIQCHISGYYDLNTVGTYPLTIDAQDKSGNQTKKEFVLNVVEESTPNISKKDYVYFRDIYQKYKDSNTEVGLDISKWQEDVDFTKLASEGVTFVMLKLGGQTEIGGQFILDPKFEENIKAALENHIRVGVYFYSYARNVNDAKKQARWVIQMIKNYDLSLPIAFDWENWNQYSTFGIGFRTLNEIASSFIGEVKHYGYEGILYSSKYYLENIWYQDDYTKWLAYYTDNNDYDGDYFIWQLCNTGKINGIDGVVDIDILKKK